MEPDDQTAPDIGVAIPEDLTGLSVAELAKLTAKTEAAFNKINDQETVLADEFAKLQLLADAYDALKGEAEIRATAEAERSEKRAELAAKFKPPVAEVTEPEAAAVETEEVVPSVEEAGIGETEVAPETSEESTLAQPVAIAASTKPRAVARPRATAPRTVSTEETRVTTPYASPLSIVASSDVPGISTGSELDRDGLSKALHARARLMGDSSYQALVASLSLPVPDSWDTDKASSDAAIRELWANRHDPAGLVASGGWCAPSETIYDFVCDFETVDGLVDIPTMGSTRGGLRYPVSPLLKDVFADADSGFTWTEADDIAAATPGGPTKPCFVIPCPSFSEVRLQAQGVCVTAGNLTDRAYPELTNRYVDLVMAAHAHRLNGLTLAKMEANSTAIAAAIVPVSGAEAILATLDWRITQTRDVYFMGEGEVLEVKLPRWVRTLIRRDLARRSGVDFHQVSNEEISAYFREIGANVQFVSDWQRLPNNTTTSMPATVKALFYPAGSHTKLTGGSIDLGVVRDSTLNSTNDYTAAWTEEFWQVVTRCASFVVTIPVCASGYSAALTTAVCPTA